MMKSNHYNPNIHHRRSIRLKGYDYSRSGMYFVTVCVERSGGFQTRHYGTRPHIFGKIENGEMVLNEYGQILQMVWNELPQHYANIQLGEFVIMPNHIHCIIIITNVDNGGIVGAGLKPAPTPPDTTTTPRNHGLSEFVRALKTFSARKINDLRNMRGEKLWQRNYYESIIRNEQSYIHIANYIINNPKNWGKDKFFTEKK
jgi:REP element-mobilizing transposase RayT